jgi:hypothetical protein
MRKVVAVEVEVRADRAPRRHAQKAETEHFVDEVVVIVVHTLAAVRPEMLDPACGAAADTTNKAPSPRRRAPAPDASLAWRRSPRCGPIPLRLLDVLDFDTFLGSDTVGVGTRSTRGTAVQTRQRSRTAGCLGCRGSSPSLAPGRHSAASAGSPRDRSRRERQDLVTVTLDQAGRPPTISPNAPPALTSWFRLRRGREIQHFITPKKRRSALGPKNIHVWS